MMRARKLYGLIVCLLLYSQASASFASTENNPYLPPIYISKMEAPKQLDSKKFSSVGAEIKGNGTTIPDWTGNMRDIPASFNFGGNGHKSPNPYQGEKPLFTINANNSAQYASRLSNGLLAMLKKYPTTFTIPVYKTHRDGRYNSLIEQRTAWNSTRTKLLSNTDGLQQYTGGVPFPFPQDANQVMWNARIIHPTPTLNGTMDDIAVFANGNREHRQLRYVSEFPFANPLNKVGHIDEQISIDAGLVHITHEVPRRQKGQMTIVREALDQVSHERQSWVYIPGPRRVRRTPTVGYDTPDGPAGMVTVDDSMGFNGAMDRYNWKLLGRKEVYVPYHAYKFDNATFNYDEILQKNHVNPEFMRYELHRVWVVEAELLKGERHVYSKRRFYIDEDSWHILLLESYDDRGELWRVGMLNTLYDFAVKGFINRANIFHDLISGDYAAMRMTNETAAMRYADRPKGSEYYTPSNLRKLGK